MTRSVRPPGRYVIVSCKGEKFHFMLLSEHLFLSGDAAFEREILDIKLLEAVVVEKDVEAACNIYLDNVKVL